jgi:hypothetical protein
MTQPRAGELRDRVADRASDARLSVTIPRVWMCVTPLIRST